MPTIEQRAVIVGHDHALRRERALIVYDAHQRPGHGQMPLIRELNLLAMALLMSASRINAAWRAMLTFAEFSGVGPVVMASAVIVWAPPLRFKVPVPPVPVPGEA